MSMRLRRDFPHQWLFSTIKGEVVVLMDSRDKEQELIDRARQGDAAAFGKLAAVHRTGLLLFIRTRLGARLRAETEAEDILQETYLKAFDSVDRFEWQGDRSFFKWIATIAEYIIRGLGRSQKGAAALLDFNHADSAPSPSRALRREERLERLQTALQSLDEDHQTVIRLARFEGLSTSEVARRMNRSPGAVRHLLLRALEKLRTNFGEDTESLGLPDAPPGDAHGT